MATATKEAKGIKISLFANKRAEENPKAPKFASPRKKQGEQWVDEAVEIPAGKYKAACWVQEAKDGSKYLSISLTQVGGAPVGGNGDIF